MTLSIGGNGDNQLQKRYYSSCQQCTISLQSITFTANKYYTSELFLSQPVWSSDWQSTTPTTPPAHQQERHPEQHATERLVQQDSVGDGRLRPQCSHLANSTNQRCLMSDWCHHLANWTKHKCCLWFWPCHFRDMPSLLTFRRELKTVLFRLSYPVDWQL